ncbi:unnamed protein product [Lactuca saligna]|uniref:MULE transposase domain-containing protein n=1 Tax=Lactuca saligna TaxID=75948 RepID=A0AA35ZM48_LACSI|nr:unnamed protein product [Lactuca saligna]
MPNFVTFDKTLSLSFPERKRKKGRFALELDASRTALFDIFSRYTPLRISVKLYGSYYTFAVQCTSLRISVHLCGSVYSFADLCTSQWISVHLCGSVHTFKDQCTPQRICVHLCKSVIDVIDVLKWLFLVNGVEVYVRNNVKNYGLNLPPNIDHEMLLQIVRIKAGVLNSHICLSIKHPELGYVMELGDETDLFQLRHVMSESKKKVHLCLTVVSEEDNDKEPKVGMTELQRANLFEFGEVPKIDDRRCEEKSNERWSDDEYTQRKTAFNPWYCIPSITDCPEPILEPIRAFRECCRKVIIMDGAHLKGKYKGTILHAVAMDSNNQILPIGYEICPKETTDSWTWLFEKLHECIGDVEGLTMVTDRASAIAKKVQQYLQSGLKIWLRTIKRGFKDGWYPVLTIQHIKCMTSKAAT